MMSPMTDGKNSSPLERAQALLAQARAAALEQARDVEGALLRVSALSREIGESGDLYPPGVRDLCRRMADEVEGQSKSLQALATRLM